MIHHRQVQLPLAALLYVRAHALTGEPTWDERMTAPDSFERCKSMAIAETIIPNGCNKPAASAGCVQKTLQHAG